MKRLSVNGRVGGIEPGDTDAVAQAEREYRTKLSMQELTRTLTLANAARPPGAAKMAGAFRATAPRGNLLRDPNELTPETIEQLKEAGAGARAMAGAAPNRAEAAGREGAQQSRSQIEVIKALGDLWVAARKKGHNREAWEDVMLGIMANLSILATDAQELPAILALVQRLDVGKGEADSNDAEDGDKSGDIRSWLLGK